MSAKIEDSTYRIGVLDSAETQYAGSSPNPAGIRTARSAAVRARSDARHAAIRSEDHEDGRRSDAAGRTGLAPTRWASRRFRFPARGRLAYRTGDPGRPPGVRGSHWAASLKLLATPAMHPINALARREEARVRAHRQEFAQDRHLDSRSDRGCQHTPSRRRRATTTCRRGHRMVRR